MDPLLCVTAAAGWKLHLCWQVCVLHATGKCGTVICRGKAITLILFRPLVAAVYLRNYSTWNFP